MQFKSKEESGENIVNLFGMKDALIGPITLLVGGAMFLGGAMLRKALNDMFDIKFSVIGCTALGSIAYVISSNLLSIKFALLIAIVGFFAGGFLLSFIGGESSEGESFGEGNYEE
jgi:hypothetical protein